MKVNRRFGELYIHARFFILVSCLAYSLAQKSEAKYSFLRYVGFQWAIRRYISTNRILISHRFENFKSYKNNIHQNLSVGLGVRLISVNVYGDLWKSPHFS
jgi:hypothetical protein